MADRHETSPKKRSRGRELMEEICGVDIEPDDPWLEVSQEHVFGRIWDRPGLTRKERRWIALSIAAASGQRDGYRAHLRMALESGDMTAEELWEWLVQFAHYAGWPLSAEVWEDLRALTHDREDGDAG